MRKTFLIFLFIALSIYSFAQNGLDHNDSLQVKEKFTLEIAPIFEWNTIFNELTTYSGLTVSGIFHQKFSLQIHGEVFLGDLTKRVVFPNFYSFEHFKVGIGGGYRILLHRDIALQPDIKFLYSHARWIEKEQQRFYISDNYIEVYPQLTCLLFPSKKISALAGVGYHFTAFSDLIGATNSDLSGVNLFAGIQFKIITK